MAILLGGGGANLNLQSQTLPQDPSDPITRKPKPETILLGEGPYSILNRQYWTP